jgi:type-F conjugative transfer system pilin assembly protein TrbC
LQRVLGGERNKLKDIPDQSPGVGFQLPSYLDTERNDRYMAKALAAGRDMASNKPSAGEALHPIVLVSFSMPENQIRALMREASRIGAVVAVRGLYNDDFQQTVVKLKALAGEYDDGVMIDPTLFARFQVTLVPTFILPLEQVAPCTNDTCTTPKHVKAAGSATLEYFLNFVSRNGSDPEKEKAGYWLTKFGDS